MIPGRRNTVVAPDPLYWCPFCIDEHYATTGTLIVGGLDGECWVSLAGTVAHAIPGSNIVHVVLPASYKGWTMGDVAAIVQRQRAERRAADYDQAARDVKAAFERGQIESEREARSVVERLANGLVGAAP